MISLLAAVIVVFIFIAFFNVYLCHCTGDYASRSDNDCATIVPNFYVFSSWSPPTTIAPPPYPTLTPSANGHCTQSQAEDVEVGYDGGAVIGGPRRVAASAVAEVGGEDEHRNGGGEKRDRGRATCTLLDM
jgi:hypothetical protein